MRKMNRVLSIFLAALVLLASGCSSILFQGSRVLYYDPAELKLKFEEVHFQSLDGTPLYGWYFKHTDARVKPKAVIFFAHGNAQNISAHFMALTFTLKEGYDFFIFDYRGFGTSGGHFQGAKEGVEDTTSALRWTDARAKSIGAPLVVFAQSLGTALTLRSLVDEKATIHPSFIALDSPFLSFEWAGASVLSQFWITTPFQPLSFLLLSDEWAPLGRIRELAPTPILVIHGEDDHVIRYALGVETFQAALPPKEMISVPGAGHIQSFWGADGEHIRSLYLEKMSAALKTL